MKVTSTLSRQGETTERNFTLPNFVYIALRDVQRSQNKEFSQGKALYEILHFDREKPCTDEITDVEDFVNGQLAQEVGEQLWRQVDKIKIIDTDGRQALFNDVPDDLDPDGTTDFQVRVRLLDATWEQIHEVRERYIGKWAAPSLIKFVESPFNSRMERINCKRELVEYLQGELDADEMESQVARACVVGESDRFEGVSKAHGLIHEVTATEWPEDITIDELENMSRGELGSIGLSRENKEDGRVPALEKAIVNEGRQPEYDEVLDMVERAYGVTTKQAKQSYAEMMEMDWMGPKVEGVRDLASDTKQYIVEDLPDSKGPSDKVPKQVGENLPVYEFLLLDRDKLDRIDRRYDSIDDALEALDELLEQAHSPDRLGKAQKQAYAQFKRQVEILKEEGFAPANGASIEGYDGGQVDVEDEEDDVELSEEEKRALGESV